MRFPISVRIHEDDRPIADEALEALEQVAHLSQRVGALTNEIAALRLTLVGLLFVVGVYITVTGGNHGGD